MIDPHWYAAPEFFFNNTTIFDNHKRGDYEVFVGEYACNSGVGTGNMMAALSEAAFITGMERNADLVTMTSYAPLFENRNDRNWAVNLIWLDTDQVVGRSSYYVQKMAADHKPTYMVESSQYKSKPAFASLDEGGIGFGTWVTQAEYKDVKITVGGQVVTPDFDQFISEKGDWTVQDGILSQSSIEQNTKRFLKGFKGDNYTMELKARKISGNEGFVIYFAMDEEGRNGFAFNLGGWNNQTTAVQDVVRGSTSSMVGEGVPHSIKTNKWYDLKIVVEAEKAELFVDGKLIIDYVHKIQPRHYLSSGYDEITGELILKVVNGENSSYTAKFNLDGASSVERKGKVVTLSAIDGEQENSFEEPQKIYPIESIYKKFGKTFEYEFKPYSYTVLRIKQK